MRHRLDFHAAPCRVCGATRRILVAHLPQTRVYQCLRCWLVVCDPLPHLESFSSGPSAIPPKESYTQAICNLDSRTLARYRELARGRYDLYRASLRRDTFRVLEIGCGAAGLADGLQRLGVEYRGIDLDHRPIEAARARGIENVETANFTTLPLSAKRYDVVFAGQVLEHVVDPRAFVDRIHEWLAPGGVIHLALPHHLALLGVISMLVHPAHRTPRFGGIEYPHHSLSYYRRTLTHLLRQRFDARVFTVSPDHQLWGQAVVPDARRRAYYLASRLVGMRSVLVGYGTAR